MMKNSIFMISELRINAQQNSYDLAQQYFPIGFVVTKQETERYKQQFVEGTGWPFLRGTKIPAFQVKELFVLD